MTQAHDGLKSLKPNRKPINTPLGIRVSMSFHSPLRSRERTLTSTLKISTISVLRHKVESSNRRSWCLWDLLWLWSYLHRLESIWEHSDQRYVTLFSKSMFFMVFLLFFNTCLSVAIDLESPRIDLHAPYTIQGMETEQSGVPNNDVIDWQGLWLKKRQLCWDVGDECNHS